MNETPTEWLTAAECSVRTGLTVRALRVYENYGLIAPGRSPAGWRRYGPRELLKLNEIGLLKVLGLTLKQIRDLVRQPTSPTLQELLELQLQTWKLRRADAERGQTVVEAALQQLRSGASLSVEELCSLIRSLELTTSAAEATPLPAEEAPSDAKALDRYVGNYCRNRALGVTTITRKEAKLILEPIGQSAIELEQTGEAHFCISQFDLMLYFEQMEQDVAMRLVIWHRGNPTRLDRTDAQTAKAIRQTIADRVRNRTPMPGSQEALRQVLDMLSAGNPNLGILSPEFAHVVRGQVPYWQVLGRYFGPIVTSEFLRVSDQGWDIYQVQHENDVHQYRIALGDDGKVYGFSEASTASEKRTLV